MPARIRNVTLLLLGASALLCAADTPGTWVDVPFVKQEKNGCGAASIAMVMQFWQRQQGAAPNADSDPARIQQALYSRQARGIYATDLKRYLEQRGYTAFAFEGREDDLQQHIEKGRPLIVALKPGAGAPLHYVVVTGFDRQHNTLWLNDPAERKLLQRALPSFEKEWKGTGNWTLLAVPQTGRASSAR